MCMEHEDVQGFVPLPAATKAHMMRWLRAALSPKLCPKPKGLLGFSAAVPHFLSYSLRL